MMTRKITDTPTYGTVHNRLHRKRGSASNFACADCGGRGEQWSLNNDSPNKVVGPYKAHGVEYLGEYSYDIKDYSPRCIKCHLKHDGKTVNENEHCSYEECGRKPIAKTLCISHYQQQLAGKELKPIRKYGEAA